MANIYLASSWRNVHQPTVVKLLREAGHSVYDFRNPAPGNFGFQWSAIDPDWKTWGPSLFREALAHPIATSGWALDQAAMEAADTCVLALPCGASAHLEAGWMAGRGKRVVVFIGQLNEPELMYLTLNGPICVNVPELLAALEPDGD